MGKDIVAAVPHVHAEVIKANVSRFHYVDGDLVWADNYGPRARKGGRAGSVDTHGYLQIKLDGIMVLAHRIIWFMFNGTFPDQVDHIDRNRRNNRKWNLRASDNTRNQHNASIRVDCTTGSTGVTSRPNGKFEARIAAFGKRHYLGLFDTLADASQAYKIAKEKYHAA